MLVEHARNVMGIEAASHAEYGADAGVSRRHPAVVLARRVGDRDLDHARHAARAASILASAVASSARTAATASPPTSRYIASAGGMRISAVDDTGEVRAVERSRHTFFLGTFYQPQRTSSPEHPHPIWTSFVRAVQG